MKFTSFSEKPWEPNAKTGGDTWGLFFAYSKSTEWLIPAHSRLHWRGWFLNYVIAPGFKGVGVSMFSRQFAVVYVNKPVLVNACPEYAALVRLQQYYASQHGYRPSWYAEPNFSGLSVNVL